MKKFLEILSVIALLVWGGVFIWFYTSGRIETYLDPSFRIFALLAGIGMIVLALFNFMTRNRAAGACHHEHAHGDACDHDHGEHDHHHDDCGHDHSHEEHHHDHGNEDSSGHDHDHDHEGTTTSIAFSLLVLLIPLLMAARYSDDRFSLGYLNKWAKIEHKMQQMKIAKERGNSESPVPSGSKENNPYANPVKAEDPVAGKTTDKSDTPPEPVKAVTDSNNKMVAKADTPPVTKDKTAPEDKPASGDKQAEWDEFTLEDLKKMVPQSSEGNFLLDVPQIFYTAGDDELMKVMEGIPVETIAQVMPETENNPKKTRLRAFRLFIECCAADARPLSIPIEFGKVPPEYKEMGWYKILGKLHFSRENDEIVPLLNIEKIEATIEPMDGMMY